MSGSDSTFLAPFGDGSSVLERVLLAIIKAHTTLVTEGHQQERLDTAMTALIGPVTDYERQLEQAVRYMARERQRDICEAEMAAIPSSRAAATTSARPIAQLAEAAARKVVGCATPAELCAVARDLRQRYRLSDQTRPMVPDSITAVLEEEAVGRILAELEEWGVAARY
ncbi:hypothetical protein [Oceaniradius stylonematis]|uniref:hypothetical protein n=1 Tax=Oceaniradius stylonematis TaxID=2184161 RepID=UPI00273E7E23|nr:hypothetical protein [Oceaniradius stylonematis]